MLKLIVLVLIALTLGGCAAYNELMCQGATRRLEEMYLYGLVLGVVAWLALYIGWFKTTVILGSLASLAIGYGSSTNVKCGVGQFHWLWAIGTFLATGLPGLMGVLGPRFAGVIEAGRERKAAELQRTAERQHAAREAATAARLAEEEERRFNQMQAEQAEASERQAGLLARQALDRHLDTIEAAVRAATPGAHDAVLLNTIGKELSAVSSSARITPTMIGSTVVQERVNAIWTVMKQKQMDDPTLLVRLRQIFGDHIQN